MCKLPRLRNNAILVTLAITLFPARARACSPDFPNSLIENDSQVLAAPPADFIYELKQIPLAGAPKFAFIQRTTTEAELDDLAHALKGSHDAEKTLSAYATVRKQIDAFLADRISRDGSQPLLAPKPLEIEIPTGLPEEFLRYLRGAIAYHNGNAHRAIIDWRSVLDLPADERHYRSTWAAFMIGRALMDEKPDEAILAFEHSRKLAQQGFADSLGLAAASFGWEGRIALDRKQYNRAIDRYLAQFACDDPSAAWSLRDVAAEIISAGPSAMKQAANDEHARRVVTAFLVSQSSMSYWSGPFANPNQVVQWFAAIDACKIANLEDTDRLAWIAYQTNLYADADRWLNQAPLTPLGHWVRAKLLLREGKLASAAAHLAEAQRGFDANLIWRDRPQMDDADLFHPRTEIHGEIGAILLAQQQYVPALGELLGNGFWQDGAYIAERVLTADELMRYVDNHWPAEKPGSQDIRALLARRLMRLDRGDEALAYFTPKLRKKAVAYDLALCEGNTLSRSAHDRAESLWTAATIARADGMELFGTELDPDSALYGGNFESGIAIDRLKPTAPSVIPASADERQRATQSALTPPRRFHYRYLAADLAWEAIALMPDNDTTAADRLCEAGGWLKAQDPKSADRFYKELITRFAKTNLAAEALKRHWFPK